MVTQDSRIIRKIKALLAKAKEVDNPEEAMIAARQARFLMDKHQIDEMDVGEHKAKPSFSKDKSSQEFKGKSLPQYVHTISIAVAVLNDAQCYMSVAGYSPRKTTFSYQGLENDVKMAHLIADYIFDILNTKVKYMPPVGALAKNNYKLGFAVGIQEQVENIIKERKREMLGNGTGLIVAKEHMLAEHFGEHSYAKAKGKEIRDMSSYSKGKAEGLRTQLNERVK